MDKCAEKDYIEQKKTLARRFTMCLADIENHRNKTECPANMIRHIYFKEEDPDVKNIQEDENLRIWRRHCQECGSCLRIDCIFYWLNEYLIHISEKNPQFSEPKIFNRIMEKVLSHIEKIRKKTRYVNNSKVKKKFTPPVLEPISYKKAK